jgi:preprotein translocase subunit Sss1
VNVKEKKLKRLRTLAHSLDTKFEGPMGFRFGLDGVLGLVPGIGDTLTTLISLYIIAEASALGVGSSTLIRMAINVAIENVMDMIPIVGNFFDFYWKANNKNIALVEKHLARPDRQTIKSRMMVALISFIIIGLLSFSIYVTYFVLKSFYLWIASLN